MRYLCKRTTLVNSAGVGKFPEAFPVFWLATPETVAGVQRKFLKATEFGMDASTRKICATKPCYEGLTPKYVLDTISELEEISEHDWQLLSSIPHWNPIEELNMLLDQFLIQERSRDAEKQREILKHVESILREAKLEGSFEHHG